MARRTTTETETTAKATGWKSVGRRTTRHSWRLLRGQTMRCARRHCSAKRRPGGDKYEYTSKGQGLAKGEWIPTPPACSGEPTSD